MSFLKLPLPKRAHSLFYQKNQYQIHLKNNNSKNFPQLESSLTNYKENKQQEKEIVSKKDKKCNIKSCCSTKVFNGESFIDNDIPSVVYLSSNINTFNEELNFQPFLPLPHTNDPSFRQIFHEKIELCNIIFNFSNPNFQVQGKREKSKSLTEINILLSKKAEIYKFTSEDKQSILQMITNNIFEQDPFFSNRKILPTTVKSNFVENSWEHLSIIYKILNQFVLLYPDECDIDLAKKAIFLFNNPDSNVRDNLAIFLKNYTRVHPEQFDEIWTQIKNVLSDVRCDIYNPYCVDPCISYINLLSKSKKITNIQYYINEILNSHLLPLYFHKNLPLFFKNLTNLVVKIISNRPDDQLNTISYLIRHFPYRCGQKQILFLNAITSIIKLNQDKDLSSIAGKLFTFISIAIESPNSKLVESALSFLMNEHMRPIILSNYELVTNIINGSLKWSSSNHWDKSIKIQSKNVLKNLINMKFDLFHNIAANNFNHQSILPVDLSDSSKKQYYNQINNHESAKTWAILSRIASKRDKSINYPKFLYKIQVQFLKNEK